MRPESVCAYIRPEISAWLDGELNAAEAGRVEAHLDVCTSCSAYGVAVERARAAVRLQLVDPVPDVADRIVERVSARGPLERRRQDRLENARIAFVAAAVAGLLVWGTSLPGPSRPSVASAGEIGGGIRAAAARLSSYRAGYDIVERGWHPRVDERRFHAEVSYSAPDRVRFIVKDLTVYPGGRGWPLNDVELVADATSWWMREPAGCPPTSFPTCADADRPIERTVVDRQPFDGSTPVPSDLILPLDSVAGSDGLVVLGRERVAGRSGVHVRIPFLQAQELIASLQVGGSWREYHPLDRADVWLDERDSFPLRITVTPNPSAERRAWARSMGYTDPDGEFLYRAELSSFDDRVDQEGFVVPRSVVTRDGAFRRANDLKGVPRPRFLAGLSFYASGTSAGDQKIVAWSRGMQWLKLTATPRAHTPTTLGEPVTTAGKSLYYVPSSTSAARRVELYPAGRTIALESNLERAVLLRVAASLPVRAPRIASVVTAAGRRIERGDPDLTRRHDFVARAGWLPAGYGDRVAVTSSNPNGTTVSVHYRRDEVLDGGMEIRITHSDAFDRLWPSSERYQVVRLRGVLGRFSAGRGELEWIEHGVYRAVSAPGFDLRTIVAIAEGLT